jgi:hypothetical protein
MQHAGVLAVPGTKGSEGKPAAYIKKIVWLLYLKKILRTILFGELNPGDYFNLYAGLPNYRT